MLAEVKVIPSDDPLLAQVSKFVGGECYGEVGSAWKSVSSRM